MLTKYIKEALRLARYEFLGESKDFYAFIPQLSGVWASGGSVEECRDTLIEVLEDWLILQLSDNYVFPVLNGVILNVVQTAAEITGNRSGTS